MIGDYSWLAASARVGGAHGTNLYAVGGRQLELGRTTALQASDGSTFHDRLQRSSPCFLGDTVARP